MLQAPTTADVLNASTTRALAEALVDGEASASTAALRYVDLDEPGYHRRKRGRGWTIVDARGRTQYRYHPRWRAVRDAANYDRLRAFYRGLPRLRAAVRRDLGRRRPCKAKVAAAVVALIERGQLRVGSDEYTRANGSYGATTLLTRHARIRGALVQLEYRAKGGKHRAVRFRDRRLARVLAQLAAQRG